MAEVYMYKLTKIKALATENTIIHSLKLNETLPHTYFTYLKLSHYWKGKK